MLDHVTPDMTAFREETFSPVAAIVRDGQVLAARQIVEPDVIQDLRRQLRIMSDCVALVLAVFYCKMQSG